ncbi:hypothetical protein OG944_38700 (plasmid) [Streptomyces anulatus]|uniref:hypothetical protein n=1 Tax=Streptomyces anulatus TaxID=1892 RepID=UPI002F9102C6
MDHQLKVNLVVLAMMAALFVAGTALYQVVWRGHLRRALRTHVRNRLRVEWVRLHSQLTARVVGPAHSVLPGLVTGLPPHRNLVDPCASRWAKGFLKETPVRLGFLAILAVAVWREADIRAAWRRPGPVPGSRDPVESLINGCVDATKWIIFVLPARVPETPLQLWERPTEAVGLLRTPIVALLLCYAAFLLLPAALALVGLNPTTPRRDQRRIAAESEQRNWPVVLLMLCAVHCGRTHAQLLESGPLELPHVSAKRAERVIRQAWKTRHERVRRHQRRELKIHASRVVAVLRKAEARQHQDPDEALRTMATLLTTIAHRYAEGRTGQLLEERQMEGVEPVADRTWLHLVISGVLIIGVLLALSRAGLPEIATGPFVSLLILGVFALVYRGRLPGPADLVDIVRGADRR